MKRSVSVTLVGIVVLIGSALTVLMGAIMGTAVIFGHSRTSQAPEIPAAALFGALLMVLPGIWGIATGVALFLLKRWARISILIFAALLVMTGGFGVPILLVMPMPAAQGVDTSVLSGIRVGIAGFYIFLAAIGIWWLILFSRPSVKEQFSGGRPLTSEDGRPLSIYCDCLAADPGRSVYAIRPAHKNADCFFGFLALRVACGSYLHRLRNRLLVFGNRPAATQAHFPDSCYLLFDFCNCEYGFLLSAPWI